MTKATHRYDLSKCLYLSPDDIRFSQDTISANFSSGEAIGNTLDALVKMELFLTDIIPISVALMDNGDYWTINNRRLWVYKQLWAMGKCSFIPCIIEQSVPRFQLTTQIGGHDIIIRGEHKSQTLSEFNAKQRKAILKKIRSTHMTDDAASRRCYKPRFGHLTHQKRRKLRGRRQLPKRENAVTHTVTDKKFVFPTVELKTADAELEAKCEVVVKIEPDKSNGKDNKTDHIGKTEIKMSKDKEELGNVRTSGEKRLSHKHDGKDCVSGEQGAAAKVKHTESKGDKTVTGKNKKIKPKEKSVSNEANNKGVALNDGLVDSQNKKRDVDENKTKKTNETDVFKFTAPPIPTIIGVFRKKQREKINGNFKRRNRFENRARSYVGEQYGQFSHAQLYNHERNTFGPFSRSGHHRFGERKSHVGQFSRAKYYKYEENELNQYSDAEFYGYEEQKSGQVSRAHHYTSTYKEDEQRTRAKHYRYANKNNDHFSREEHYRQMESEFNQLSHARDYGYKEKEFGPFSRARHYRYDDDDYMLDHCSDELFRNMRH